MAKIIDARGLACPQPVMLTAKAMGEADEITTIVDDDVAAQNLTRLGGSRGFEVEVRAQADGIQVKLRRQGSAVEQPEVEGPREAAGRRQGSGPSVLFVSSDCLGHGPAELGERLMGAFFHTLLELSEKPKSIIFINSGVKLAVEGSRILDDLRALVDEGTEISACGTCLSYYELTEQLAVGRISNMYDIAKALCGASRIVEL